MQNQNYADVLESYLIPAEEGLKDAIKNVASKVVQFLTALKNKVIELFSRIIGAFKKKPAPETDEDKQAKIDAINLAKELADTKKRIALAVTKLNGCIGILSVAVANSKIVRDTDDDKVQSALERFDEQLDGVDELIDTVRLSELSSRDRHELQETYLSKLEAIKNAFVQEIDTAVKIASAANYNMSNTASHMSAALSNQLCRANGRFMSVYSDLLNRMY